MNDERELAARPDDLTRLFVERANAGDAEGLAALYEPDAVLAYPPGSTTEGRKAIQMVFEKMLTMGIAFTVEEALPTVQNGDLALTSTHRADGNGVRVQVARRQPDGSWQRTIDQPEAPKGQQ
jgi:uncharacterized protein (TIGR02246 family)